MRFRSLASLDSYGHHVGYGHSGPSAYFAQRPVANKVYEECCEENGVMVCVAGITTALSMSFAGSGLKSCIVKGHEFPVATVKDLMEWVCKKLMIFDPRAMRSEILRHPNANWIGVGTVGKRLPRWIGEKYYVDVSGNAVSLMTKIERLLRWVGWKEGEVRIKYVKSGAGSKPSVMNVAKPSVAPTPASPAKQVGAVVEEEKSEPRSEIPAKVPDAAATKAVEPQQIKTNLVGEVPEPAVSVSENKEICQTNLSSEPPLQLFIRKILRDFPNGFDFKETSKRLAEARVGCKMSSEVERALQEIMVQRQDGIWVLRRMVLSSNDFERILERARGILEKDNVLDVDSFYEEVKTEVNNLNTVVDFRRYFKKFMSEKLPGSASGNVIVNLKPEDSDVGELLECAENDAEKDSSATRDFEEELVALLKERFSNGIRPASMIDQNKVRRAYVERYGTEIPPEVDLGRILPRLGIVHDGKVFPKPESGEEGWRKIIDGLVDSGHKVFSFARLMALHADKMMSVGIISDEMLRASVMQSADSGLWVGLKYLVVNGCPHTIEEVIQASLQEDQVLVSEKELLRKFPYVDSADIHRVLASDGKYFWNSPEWYVIPSRIEFDEPEVRESIELARQEIEDRGYFSLAQLELSESAALNDPRITPTAIRRVFFYRYLSREFDIHGQILCRHGAEIDGRYPLRDFYRSHSELTVDQIYAVAKEYNIVGDMALLAAHEEMVRVDGDRFVSTALVTFDVLSVDADLSHYCTGAVSTLNTVNLDGLSSVPGYPWNRYLLEAFLRRESRKFKLMTPSTASREPAGVIVRRDSGVEDPVLAFAKAAVASGVEADAHAVGEYLVATRCTLRRGASLIEQVVSKMRDLYEVKR